MSDVPADGSNRRPVDELQLLVTRRLAELGTPRRPLGYKPAALKAGGKISHEQIRQIALGNRPERISDEKLQGLADALSLPVADVYEAAKTQRPGKSWRWPARFDRLSESERRIVESVAAGFFAAYERGQRDG